MKLNSTISTLVVCLMGACLPALTPSATADSNLGDTHLSHRQSAWRASQYIGATVRDRADQTLGMIQDLVFNPATRQVDFAVISLVTPNEAGKLTAVPWPLLRTSAEPGRVVATVDRSRITAAPTFEAGNWPDFSQASYSQRLYSHYGLAYERPAMGGRVPLEGQERGYGRESNFPRPQPDGREVFPYLDERNKSDYQLKRNQ